MMAAKKQPPPICLTCGGTGAEPIKAFGPFLTSVQKRHREILERHLPARRAVLEVLDKEIARQAIGVVKLMDAKQFSFADLLAEAHDCLEKACVEWGGDEQEQAVRNLTACATFIVFVLESYEAAHMAEGEIEDK